MISQNPSVACSLSHLKRDLTTHAITFENLQIWKCTIWKWSLLYARWLFLHFLGNILQPPLLAIGAGGEKGCSNMKRRTGSNKNAIFDTSYETHTTFHIPILRRKKNETMTAGWNWIPCLTLVFKVGRRKMYPNSKSRRAWLWQISPSSFCLVLPPSDCQTIWENRMGTHLVCEKKAGGMDRYEMRKLFGANLFVKEQQQQYSSLPTSSPLGRNGFGDTDWRL